MGCRIKRLVNKDGSKNFPKTSSKQKLSEILLSPIYLFSKFPISGSIALSAILMASSWLLYGFLWFSLALLRSDGGDKEISDCVKQVPNFVNAFIFSVETQTTIGYGSRVIDPGCADAMILLLVQLATGPLIQALALVLYVRSLTYKGKPVVNFSAIAILSNNQFKIRAQRDGLIPIAGASVRASIIFYDNDETVYTESLEKPEKKMCNEFEALRVEELQYLRKTKSKRKFGLIGGHVCKFRKSQLSIICAQSGNEKFLMSTWPIEFVHNINEESPLFRYFGEEVKEDNFEFVVSVEGSNLTTGLSFVSRTSYTTEQIKTGKQFKKADIEKKEIVFSIEL